MWPIIFSSDTYIKNSLAFPLDENALLGRDFDPPMRNSGQHVFISASFYRCEALGVEDSDGGKLSSIRVSLRKPSPLRLTPCGVNVGDLVLPIMSRTSITGHAWVFCVQGSRNSFAACFGLNFIC